MLSSNWRSRACLPCKTKKIKCDETLPSCRRCEKSGIACSGYPEPGLVFRDMNSIAKKKVKARVKARSRARAGGEDSSPPLSISTVSSPAGVAQYMEKHRQYPAKISPPMSTNWQDIAVPRFFADYVFKSRLFPQSGLSFLPELYGRPDLHAPLREALHAVAWLSLSNQLGLEWLRLEACRSYIHAAELMANLLQNPDEARHDAVLATNYLFGLFEFIDGFGGSSKIPGGKHHSGRECLVQLRGKEQFNTSIGINIFRKSYAHLTVKYITEHAKPPEEASIWLETIPTKDPGFELARCNLRSARLLYEVQKLFDSNSADEWWIVNMLQAVKEAILIDLTYQEWAEALPSTWRPRSLRKPGTRSAKVSNAETFSNRYSEQVYQDIYIAFISNNYRASRIHLHEVLLRSISLIESNHHFDNSFDFEQTRIQSREIIGKLIADICASINFCFGDIDSSGDPATSTYRMPLGGYLLLWPVWVAFVSAPAGSQCKLWLRSKLVYISNHMGIRAAGAVLNRRMKGPWDLRSLKSGGRENPHSA